MQKGIIYYITPLITSYVIRDNTLNDFFKGYNCKCNAYVFTRNQHVLYNIHRNFKTSSVVIDNIMSDHCGILMYSNVDYEINNRKYTISFKIHVEIGKEKWNDVLNNYDINALFYTFFDKFLHNFNVKFQIKSYKTQPKFKSWVQVSSSKLVDIFAQRIFYLFKHSKTIIKKTFLTTCLYENK